MLGCFSYLRKAFKVGSLTFSLIGSKSEYWEMLRFFTILPKRLLKISAVSLSVFTISPFILFQKVYQKPRQMSFPFEVLLRSS